MGDSQHIKFPLIDSVMNEIVYPHILFVNVDLTTLAALRDTSVATDRLHFLTLPMSADGTSIGAEHQFIPSFVNHMVLGQGNPK